MADVEDIYRTIAARIRQLREARGFTQQDLAEATEDGRSSQAVYGAMTTVASELLAEMTAAGAKSEDHVLHLCSIVQAIIESHAIKCFRHRQEKRREAGTGSS